MVAERTAISDGNEPNPQPNDRDLLRKRPMPKSTRKPKKPSPPSTTDDTVRYRFPAIPKRPEPTGVIVSGTDPCTCGHSPEEHGREPAYPGSTACRECEDCVAYEADPEAA